jgi:hypothetical protein
MDTQTYSPRFLTEEKLDGLVLLGLSGEVGSGKTFLTRWLVETFGFTPESYANPFKMDGIMHAGLPIEEVFGSGKSDKTRRWLQERGTEYGRAIAGMDVWCHYLETMIWYNLDHGVQAIAVADCRFPNEIAAIQALGGKVYRITGRGGAEGVLAQHSSETVMQSIETYDRYVDNSPGREREVLALLEHYLWHDFGLVPVTR